MSSHNGGSLRIQEYESLTLPLLWMLPPPRIPAQPIPASLSSMLKCHILTGPMTPTTLSNLHHTPTLIFCPTSPLTNSPNTLLIYCAICTYFLSLLFIMCFHPLVEEFQEGRIFFLFCFLVFPVPRHCLTHNKDSINMCWMNEWVNKWMRSSRILKWTDRCPLALSIPQHTSANDLSQKYIDRSLSPVLSILCGQRLQFNRVLHGSLVEEMCSRLWLHVRVKWWPWLTLLPYRGYFLIVTGTHYP